MNIICDKCGSGNIEDVVLDMPPEPPPIKMSEYQGFPRTITVNAVMIYHKHRLTCKSCGFTCEYTA